MDQIILSYVNTFLGYGDPKNPFWFIGMEEGGGNNHAQLMRRFNYWNDHDAHDAHHAHQTEDLVSFTTAINLGPLAAPPLRFQGTWQKLIRIWLNAHDLLPVENQDIQYFQANCLGRTVGHLPNICAGRSPCLFELMPLPSPRVSLWLPHYPQLAQDFQNLAFLITRREYKRNVMERRIELLHDKIVQCKPKVVCFYGKRHHWIDLPQWMQVAGVNLIGQPLHHANGLFLGNCWQGANQTGTSFIVSLHPQTCGVSNDYFDAVGTLIQPLL